MSQSAGDGVAHPVLREIESIGPWPFITRRTYLHPTGSTVVWQSREHRKGLAADDAARVAARERGVRSLWMPRTLNWWIGTVFALGASLFLVGAVVSLFPALAMDAASIGAVYFAGSIPFTIAAYLQLFQAANTREFLDGALPKRHRPAIIGWRPRDIGWMSCALQFAGTLLFNVSTFDAMGPTVSAAHTNLVVWAPDAAGSVLFLASGYLAYAETCHQHLVWKPRGLSWWVTAANLIGCIAFMVSAVFAFVPARSPGFDAEGISTACTAAGAVGFLIGSVLMLPEASVKPENG